MCSKKLVRGLVRACCLGALFIVVSVFGAPEAMAQCSGSAGPIINDADANGSVDGPVDVGDVNVASSMTLLNTSSAAGCRPVTVTAGSIVFTPSCGSTGTAGTCGAGFEDPGIFAVHGESGALDTDVVGLDDCAGVTFTISGPAGPAGEWTFTDTAGGPVVLASILDDVTAKCTIPFQVDVLAMPNLDLTPGGAIETGQHARAFYQGVGLTGGGQGTNQVEVDFTCDVTVDKQVSCDGGGTFVDEGLVTANEDGTFSCAGADAVSVIQVRYQAENTGNLDLIECTLTESNVELGPVTVPDGGTILVGDITSFFGPFSTEGQTCSETLAGGEPDTGTIDCVCDAGAAGQVEASAFDEAEFTCESCEIEVDKRVSCNGTDFVDVSFLDDGTETCVGWNPPTDGSSEQTPEPLVVQWWARNTGQFDVENCRLDDTNAILDATIPGTVPVGAEAQVHLFSDFCSEALDTAEGGANTATLVCDCRVDENTVIADGATDPDTAGFDCQNPGLLISKVCEPIEGTPNFDVEVTVTNTSTDAGLQNCVATDEYFANQFECGTAGDGTNLPLPSPADNFVLNPGGIAIFNTTLSDGTITSDTCNSASVTCEGADEGLQELKEITNTDTDVCEVQGEGCFTRTPGYWCTHPDQTDTVLGDGLEVCGVLLTEVADDTQGSATENLGFGGADFKENSTSPQQLQLIRQCTAAALNLAISGEADLQCESEFADINEVFAACCTIGIEDDPETPENEAEPAVCDSGATGQEIADSGCIEMLDAFNNLDADTGDDFADVGLVNSKAEPLFCRESNGNGFVNAGPDYGPPNGGGGGPSSSSQGGKKK